MAINTLKSTFYRRYRLRALPVPRDNEVADHVTRWRQVREWLEPKKAQYGATWEV